MRAHRFGKLAAFLSFTLPIGACVNLDDVPTACSSDPSTCEGADSSLQDSTTDSGKTDSIVDTRDAASESGGDAIDSGVPEADAADTADTYVPLDAACEVGAVTCVGSERRGCGDAGGFVIETCGSPKLCKPAACDPPSCAVGARRCAGNISQICNSDRTGYDDFKTCSAKCVGSGDCLDVTAVSNAEVYTCARMSDSTAYCWGSNIDGVFGDGTVGPGRASPAIGPSLVTVASLAAGAQHNCALHLDGTVSCWGRNANGQLGDGTFVDHFNPKTITGLSGVMELTSGDAHTCARLSDGSVKCWGGNTYGQLGDATKVKKNVPTAVSGLSSGVSSLRCGWNHCCAVVGGSVKCWGQNNGNQIGDGSAVDQATPISTNPVLSGVALSRASCASTCVIMADKSTRCWGGDGEGELGDLGATDVASPTKTLAFTDVADIAIGEFWGCAILGDTSVQCFGALPGAAKSLPAPFGGLTGATRIVAASAVTCVVASGGLQCWGRNAEGQLGDATTVAKNAPVVPRW